MSQQAEVATTFAYRVFASEAFQYIETELAIFFATIAIAVVLKLTNFSSGCSAGYLHFGFARQPARKIKLCAGNVDAQPIAKAEEPRLERVERTTVGRNAAPVEGPASILDAIVAKAANKNEAEALSLYAEMRSTGLHLQIKELARRSARHSALNVYNALVQAAVKVGRPQLIDQFLDDMVSAKIERTLSFYESTMKVLAAKKHYEEALSVYNRLHAEGFQASPVTLSCLINFAAELGDLDSAIGFFEQLSAASTPSIRAYMTALRVYSKRHDWTKSLEIFRTMQVRNVSVDSLILNTVLGTGVAAGKTQAAEAEALLHEQAGTNPNIVDVISYNTLLKSYANQKAAKKALQLLDQMSERGVKPNSITFNTVMDAAVRGSQVEDAWSILERMQAAGIQPDKYTCTILVKGLHEDATPKQLSKLIDALQLAIPYCDSAQRISLFRGIIQVAARLSNSALLMRAFRQMQELHVAPTRAEYEIMIKSLAVQGDTNHCSAIWRYALAQQPLSGVAIEKIFQAVVEELAEKRQVEGVICTFESLRAAVMGGAPGLPDSQKCVGSSTAQLLQRCHDILLRTSRA